MLTNCKLAQINLNYKASQHWPFIVQDCFKLHAKKSQRFLLLSKASAATWINNSKEAKI